MIITQYQVDLERMRVEIKYQRDLRRLARLEETAKLHRLEHKLKRFKKIRFVKEDKGVRLYCSDSQLDRELFTYDFYEELKADMYATKMTVQEHYNKSKRNYENQKTD